MMLQALFVNYAFNFLQLEGQLDSFNLTLIWVSGFKMLKTASFYHVSLHQHLKPMSWFSHHGFSISWKSTMVSSFIHYFIIISDHAPCTPVFSEEHDLIPNDQSTSTSTIFQIRRLIHSILIQSRKKILRRFFLNIFVSLLLLLF